MFNSTTAHNKVLLMKPLLQGRICNVTWKTNKGNIRTARIRLWSKSGITYFPRVMENPCAHIPEYITCEDLDKKAKYGDTKGWININTVNLIEVKAQKTFWLF